MQWHEKNYTEVYNVLARFKDLVRIKEYKNPPNLVSTQEKRKQLIRRFKSICRQTPISVRLEEDMNYEKLHQAKKKIKMNKYT